MLITAMLPYYAYADIAAAIIYAAFLRHAMIRLDTFATCRCCYCLRRHGYLRYWQYLLLIIEV